MSKIREVDDLTPEEIKAIEEYYANDDKIRFDTAEEFIKWLHDDH